MINRIPIIIAIVIAVIIMEINAFIIIALSLFSINLVIMITLDSVVINILVNLFAYASNSEIGMNLDSGSSSVK